MYENRSAIKNNWFENYYKLVEKSIFCGLDCVVDLQREIKKLDAKLIKSHMIEIIAGWEKSNKNDIKEKYENSKDMLA